ncbi:MAG: hypothetical protein WBV74_11145 [Pseudonocardiaceae bacterium]
MSLQIVRFTALDDEVDRARQGVDRLFGAVRAAQPEGVRYVAMPAADGPGFLLVLHLADGVPNPLPGIPAAAFRGDRTGWTGEPSAAHPMTVPGTHRMLDR